MSLCEVQNQKFLKEDDVCKHLLIRGFLPYYENWIVQGETYITYLILFGPLSRGISHVVNDEGDANLYRSMTLDAMGMMMHTIMIGFVVLL